MKRSDVCTGHDHGHRFQFVKPARPSGERWKDAHALAHKVTDWHRLSRRAFLGGAGAAVSLPFLEALSPRGSWAAPGDPLRMILIFWPNGMYLPHWVPTQTGTNFTLPTVMAPLGAAATNVRAKINIISNLNNIPGYPEGNPAKVNTGDHAAGTGALFTFTAVTRADGLGVRNAVSLDQKVAEVIGASTRIPSMQLGLRNGANSGDCDYGFGCVYCNNISWKTATQPLQKTIDPKKAFNDLFAGFTPGDTSQEQLRRLARRTSVLDYVAAEVTTLKPKLSAYDRDRLDRYFTSIRDLEKTLQATPPTMTTSCNPTMPSSVNRTFNLQTNVPEMSKAMNDIMTLAFQCDATRVFSYMLGTGYPSDEYPFIGISENHHELSHSQNDTYRRINVWLMEQIADLLKKLDSVSEGGRTLLDNSAVFVHSDCADSSSHRHENMPILLGGSLGGKWATGRHLRFGGQPVANLGVTLMNGLGVTGGIGDSTGPLSLA